MDYPPPEDWARYPFNHHHYTMNRKPTVGDLFKELGKVLLEWLLHAAALCLILFCAYLVILGIGSIDLDSLGAFGPVLGILGLMAIVLLFHFFAG